MFPNQSIFNYIINFVVKKIDYQLDVMREVAENANNLLYCVSDSVKIDDVEMQEKMQKLLDMLDDNDDVQNVFHNWEEPEEE